ncbi:MAG: Rid family hydrolase, partial [Puniceicoccales bacterium]
SAGQTVNILKAYHGQVEDKGFSLKENCLRTWLFVKDVDYNYQGVVEARKDFFAELGMTAETHYIASTGIEGRHANPRMNVMLDAYTVGGLAPEQIKFLQARENLNPTHEYGVTFERGTSVDYGDRRHILISGTASIDNRGQILHRNDVRKQTARAVENIIALLNDAEASMDDVAHLIVYLRDIADRADVERYIEAHYPHVPKTFVWAPVCRPGWLVEIECMAIKPIEETSYSNF